jgi:hypothetical protein
MNKELSEFVNYLPKTFDVSMLQGKCTQEPSRSALSSAVVFASADQISLGHRRSFGHDPKQSSDTALSVEAPRFVDAI